MNKKRKKILVLTVGGSDTPLVNSIKSHCPDFVIFIPSKKSALQVDGEGTPCEDARNNIKRESIVAQCAMAETQYCKIELEKEDDLNYCCMRIDEEINKMQEDGECAEGNIIVDYTGGTKTMSSALAIVALWNEWEIYIMSGLRNNLRQVVDGTERKTKIIYNGIKCREIIKSCVNMLNRYDYSGCCNLLSNADIFNNVSDSKEELWLQQTHYTVQCLNAWDMFAYEKAREYFSNGLVNAEFRSSHASFLTKIIKTWQLFTAAEKESRKGYNGEKKVTERLSSEMTLHPVYDLYLNAERCMAKGRYDDGVGRIYRALELLAQFYLAKMPKVPIFTANIKVEDLTEQVQDEYRRKFANELSVAGKEIKIGLIASYELISSLALPLGEKMSVGKKLVELREKINLRNESFFAHGFQPIGEKKAREFLRFAVDILTMAEGDFLYKGKNVYEKDKESWQMPQIL